MLMSAVELLRTHSLPMVLEQEILAVLLGGELAPGDHLNEKDLASRFGISRGPVREALRSMESSGLIEQVPNRGFFVRQLTTQQAYDLYDVRAVLFGLAGKLLARRITEKEATRLATFIADMDAATAANDFDSYVPLNFAFHEFIVQNAGNTALAQQYLGLVKQLRLYRTRSLHHVASMHASQVEHHKMVDALIRRDPEEAQRTHHRHVEAAKERLIAIAADLK
ncbi:FCD domain-containing protein [Neorhizobium sp. NCHU2750]|uniref:FCD domain-containing protein n=1 Tax=Neorhizobium sp. NCHU2750 TaxID=1825976 RepID=UPI000E75485D|nr:GntR family transcriptional regulator [Neorhizobium sp. NCHU2750]